MSEIVSLAGMSFRERIRVTDERRAELAPHFLSLTEQAGITFTAIWRDTLPEGDVDIEPPVRLLRSNGEESIEIPLGVGHAVTIVKTRKGDSKPEWSLVQLTRVAGQLGLRAIVNNNILPRQIGDTRMGMEVAAIGNIGAKPPTLCGYMNNYHRAEGYIDSITADLARAANIYGEAGIMESTSSLIVVSAREEL